MAIDEPSFAEIGLQWPWPRSLHARLVEALRKAGAKAIGARHHLCRTIGRPAADAALAAALGPDVVLAGDETLIKTPHADQTMRVEPLPEFLAAGAKSGIASIVLDGDGALRRLPRYPDGFAAVLARPPVRRGRVPGWRADAGVRAGADATDGLLLPGAVAGRFLPKDFFRDAS